ncbi:MAG TPA: ABC transporter permease [Trueperaceae bacterium]
MRRARLGLLLLGLIALATIVGPGLMPYDPVEPDYRALYAPPSLEHPLGTDGLGRDVLTRALAGGRVSLAVATGGTLLALVSGLMLGVFAAQAGGALETSLVRLFDAVLAFPGFLLVLLAVVALGGGALQTILALGLAGSPLYFRLSRAYAHKGLVAEYVVAGEALGATRQRLLVKYVVPNFLGPLLVQGGSTVATFLLVEASLSYLGLGVPLPTPSWGNVLQDARSFLTRQPWAALGPGIFLALAALSLQMISDGLRDGFDKSGR